MEAGSRRRRRRCSHSAGSEVLAAAVLGLGPQSSGVSKAGAGGEQNWEGEDRSSVQERI